MKNVFYVILISNFAGKADSWSKLYGTYYSEVFARKKLQEVIDAFSKKRGLEASKWGIKPESRWDSRKKVWIDDAYSYIISLFEMDIDEYEKVQELNDTEKYADLRWYINKSNSKLLDGKTALSAK